MAVDDATVVDLLQALLKVADLQNTTEKMLRKQLEQQLGADLADKKKLIRAEVCLALCQRPRLRGAHEACTCRALQLLPGCATEPLALGCWGAWRRMAPRPMRPMGRAPCYAGGEVPERPGRRRGRQ